ncbi:MAG: cell division protein ZipA C-terminal FtsZ-binding domain-containing protein [Steroidobacteraceae bacterium]
MSQLRWTLLILGGVFIAALALWEWRRPRQGRGKPLGSAHAPSEPHVGALPRADAGEPWIGEESLEREPAAEESWRESTAPDPLGELPTMLVDAPEEDEAPVAHAAQTALAAAQDWDALEEGVGSVRILGGSEPPAVVESPVLPVLEPPVLAPSGRSPPVLSPPPAAANAEAPPRVEWPPDEMRRILALRLMAPEERFSGRLLRLALAAEGFRLGRFEIFHLPDAHGCALVSVASLTRPGTFDLDAMDGQRYAGLNLFTVLPGSLPAAEAFEALLAAALNLNERLQGEVQDERGEPLSEERLAQLRQTLAVEPGEALS